MEIDFAFVDIEGRPFYCHMWENELWLFCWRIDHWVSLRKLLETETRQFPRNLLSKQQQIYHDQHAKWEAKEVWQQ